MNQGATDTKQQTSGIRGVLEEHAKQLARSRSVRPGCVVVRSSGQAEVQYRLECSAEGARVAAEGTLSADLPKVELIGDLKQIEGVLSGKKDARKHFLAGGFRIRGDLRYASEVGMALGVLKEPL